MENKDPIEEIKKSTDTDTSSIEIEAQDKKDDIKENSDVEEPISHTIENSVQDDISEKNTNEENSEPIDILETENFVDPIVNEKDVSETISETPVEEVKEETITDSIDTDNDSATTTDVPQEDVSTDITKNPIGEIPTSDNESNELIEAPQDISNESLTESPVEEKTTSNSVDTPDSLSATSTLEEDTLADEKVDSILADINEEVPLPTEEQLQEEHVNEEDTLPESDKPKGKVKKAGRRRKILDRVIIVFLALVLIGSVSGFGVLYSIVNKVSADGLADKMVSKDSSIFLASDGKTIIGELGGESRENITYSQVPQSTIDAFLSIEDSRFYKHNGFDLPRFISSALNNMKTGSFSQGGSTLTMQTVDNFVMKPQEEKALEEGKTFSKVEQIERKIQEIWLSMQVEKELSKTDIMTKYLNQINFGQHTRGIQKGAQYYFGKNVEDLNLSESAFLAGVINAPNSYNPYRGVEDGVNFYAFATDRRNDTLYQMLNHGYISETEYKLAKSTKLAFLVNGEPDASTTDPYKDYVRAAADEVIEKYKVDPATTPMVIYTALDINAQKEANKVSAGKVVNLDYNKYFQIGFSVLNNKTGEIRAVSAGRTDIKSAAPTQRFRFNEPHQPGSSVKPILDYAPSFDKLGYCTGRVYVDKAMSIGGWNVVNSDQRFYGKVSMERAIAQSLNTPAVQTYNTLLNTVGYDEMIKYNKALGFDEKTSDKVDIQYSIGGSNMQASTVEMAAAYATLANGGNYVEPHMVRQITYKDTNKTVKAKVKKQNAMSPQAAYMTSELLYQAIFGKDSGQNLMSRLGFGAYPVYGKTGTSDWAQDAYKYGGPMKDEWMINYTSEYTIATWTGFDGGVVGGNTYISDDLLYRNIPGWINKHMLDALATGNEHRIQNPGGISSYGGGLIKTEWLSSAAKNNPLTIENSKTDNKSLKAALEAAKKINKNDYTAETYAKLMEAIAAAEKVMKDDLAPQGDIDKALKAIESAQNGLVSSANKSSLQSTINSANGIDRSKYTDESYARLRAAIDNAKAVLNNKKATQSEIDAQINAINSATNALVGKPVINKDALGASINGARAMNSASYTPDSYAQFMNVVNAAQAVFDNPNATQAEVDAQVSAISNAQNALQPAQ